MISKETYISMIILNRLKPIEWVLIEFLFSGQNYWLSDEFELCADENAEAINDEYECKLAISSILHVYPNVRYAGSLSIPLHPKGCYLRDTESVFFNNHYSGGRNSTGRQFCKLRGE